MLLTALRSPGNMHGTMRDIPHPAQRSAPALCAGSTVQSMRRCGTHSPVGLRAAVALLSGQTVGARPPALVHASARRCVRQWRRRARWGVRWLCVLRAFGTCAGMACAAQAWQYEYPARGGGRGAPSLGILPFDCHRGDLSTQLHTGLRSDARRASLRMLPHAFAHARMRAARGCLLERLSLGGRRAELPSQFGAGGLLRTQLPCARKPKRVVCITSRRRATGVRLCAKRQVECRGATLRHSRANLTMHAAAARPHRLLPSRLPQRARSRVARPPMRGLCAQQPLRRHGCVGGWVCFCGSVVRPAGLVGYRLGGE